MDILIIIFANILFLLCLLFVALSHTVTLASKRANRRTLLRTSPLDVKRVTVEEAMVILGFEPLAPLKQAPPVSPTPPEIKQELSVSISTTNNQEISVVSIPRKTVSEAIEAKENDDLPALAHKTIKSNE